MESRNVFGSEGISDFSPIAEQYDETRTVPGDVLVEAIRRIESLGFLPPESRLLDLGCGTGMLSLPLARRGHQVIGIDVSEAMLDKARTKAREAGADVTFQSGDARCLTIPTSSIDVVIASKLFQHISEWPAVVGEIVRVSRRAFLYVNEKGAFRNSIRQRFEKLADASGFVSRYKGTKDHELLVQEFSRHGCVHHVVPTEDLRWEKNVDARSVLADFRDRLFAEFWQIPQPKYQSLIAELEAWVRSQPHGIDTTETLEPFLQIDVFELSESDQRPG